MKRVPPNVETIALAMFAAVPFYFNAALSVVSLALYHFAFAAVLVGKSRSPGATMPRALLRAAALVYLPFYFADGIAISHSLIRATGHLLFFIAIYQAVDRDSERNHPQRLLVIFLIAIASIATSTHITIVAFVAGFAYLLIRQLTMLSREESARLVGAPDVEPRVSRSAAVYLALLIVAAALFFPLLPRVRNPFVRGAGFSSQGASTGFSDAIDFTSGRTITSDPRVLARLTIPGAAAADFTPIRLRGGHYDRYLSGRWTSRPVRNSQRLSTDADGFVIARPTGTSTTIRIRQTRTAALNQRLFLPVGTWQVRGPAALFEGPNRGSFIIPGPGEALIDFAVAAARDVAPITPPTRLPTYEVEPAIQRLADRIATDAGSARENALRIESYLSSRYTYVPNPESLGGSVEVEHFLLSVRKGHCEHFAAGMVLLLAARGVPARVVGGYYGGEYNPLGGYWVIRQRDAHAWVEVWEGSRWTTWDPTPADRRPGSGTANAIAAYASALAESITFFWDRYILTFGLSDQVNLILSAFYAARDTITRLRSGLGALPSFGLDALLAATGIIALVALLVALLWRLRRRASLFDRLAARLSRLGLSITPSMTGTDVVSLVRRFRPALVPHVERVVTLYERDRFSAQPISHDEREEARLALRQVRGQQS